jgi:hypothetical protein
LCHGWLCRTVNKTRHQRDVAQYRSTSWQTITQMFPTANTQRSVEVQLLNGV